MLIIKLLLIILLFFVFLQDLKYQAVSWVIFPISILLSFVLLSIEYSIKLFGIYLVINFAFISFQIIVLLLYYWIKNKTIKGLFKNGFGIGDLLFLFIVLPLFSSFNFIVFFLSSLIFSLILFLVLKETKLYNSNKIPLAGFQSIYLILCLIIGFILKIDFYSDTLLLTKIGVL